MASFKPPNNLKFDEDIAKNFEQFHNSFKYYMKASGYEKKDDETKIAIFLNIAGEEAHVVFESFELEDKKKIYKEVIQAFENHCAPVKNETYDRYKFFNRLQGDNETGSPPTNRFGRTIRKPA